MENTRCKVLLIEDDAFDQMAFKRSVKDESLLYDYTIAGSVSKAKELLANNKYDIVVVDHILGDGTAFDVLDSIIIDTPAIFATGGGSEELAVKALKAGASDYLIKDPARNYLKVLPEVIKNAIRHKKAEDELKRYHDNLEALVKERTEQLAAEKELLSVTLSGMGDGLIAVDPRKRITLFNKVAEDLTGWRFNEALGEDVDEIFQVIDEQTRRTLVSPIDKVIDSGKIETGTDRDALVAKNGHACPISVTAAPIRKNDGTMSGIVMVFHDVSQKREIDRMKSDFISSVSHELRTPLTSIKAYTETILCDSNMPEETRIEFLRIIDEESDRLSNLIEALLEISLIESGTVKFVREPVDVSAVINQVLSALQPLADQERIELKLDIADGLPELQGDKGKIRSAVTNIVNNAIKFTPEQGQVAISARIQGKQLLISVSDTGIGIPKEELPKIFGRFYRVHQPGKQIQGTGLGLAIVKEIVMMHDGRIEVESEEGLGTTVSMFLPLTPQRIKRATAKN